jgi:hypothetical protein
MLKITGFRLSSIDLVAMRRVGMPATPSEILVDGHWLWVSGRRRERVGRERLINSIWYVYYLYGSHKKAYFKVILWLL